MFATVVLVAYVTTILYFLVSVKRFGKVFLD